MLNFPGCDQYARGIISKEASFTLDCGFRCPLLWLVGRCDEEEHDGRKTWWAQLISWHPGNIEETN